jgi:hypothetical protein
MRDSRIGRDITYSQSLTGLLDVSSLVARTTSYR